MSLQGVIRASSSWRTLGNDVEHMLWTDLIHQRGKTPGLFKHQLPSVHPRSGAHFGGCEVPGSPGMPYERAELPWWLEIQELPVDVKLVRTEIVRQWRVLAGHQ